MRAGGGVRWKGRRPGGGLLELALLLACATCGATQPYHSEDIHFDFDSAELTPYARLVLDEDLVHFTAESRDYPQLVFTICAYADEAEHAPETVARQRATVVKTYLERKGVALERLRTAIYGYRPREAPFTSGSDLNRRVELVFSGACTGQAQR